MLEGGRPIIPQSELKRFQTTVSSLVKQKDGLGWGEYSVNVEGEPKVAELFTNSLKTSASIQLRDKAPSGPKKEYIFEEIFCAKKGNGELGILYAQGSLVQNEHGELVESPGAFEGETIRYEIEGDPVQEFYKLTDVMEQIKENPPKRWSKWPFRKGR